jgi:pimeloyl-ACP methyl ester carboxylesterase
MRLFDFILRHLAELSVLLASLLFAAFTLRGVSSVPKYRYRREAALDTDASIGLIILSPELQTEKVNFRSRIAEFFRSHKLKTLATLFLCAFVLSLNAPGVKTQLVTAALAFPQPLCSKPTNRKLLLFIHGWKGDSQTTWQRFPSLACSDPALTDVDVIVVDYPTFMAQRNLNLAPLASWLNEHLDFASKYQRVAIVAHSMGGLLAREIIVLKSLHGSQKPIVAMVEVASPHLGANPATIASALGISRPLTEEMREGSSFLVTMQTEWQQIKPRPATQCYGSPHDDVVSETSAAFQCDKFTSYPQWGHRELVKPVDQRDERYSFPIRFITSFFGSVAPPPVPKLPDIHLMWNGKPLPRAIRGTPGSGGRVVQFELWNTGLANATGIYIIVTGQPVITDICSVDGFEVQPIYTGDTGVPVKRRIKIPIGLAKTTGKIGLSLLFKGVMPASGYAIGGEAHFEVITDQHLDPLDLGSTVIYIFT